MRRVRKAGNLPPAALLNHGLTNEHVMECIALKHEWNGKIPCRELQFKADRITTMAIAM